MFEKVVKENENVEMKESIKMNIELIEKVLNDFKELISKLEQLYG